MARSRAASEYGSVHTSKLAAVIPWTKVRLRSILSNPLAFPTLHPRSRAHPDSSAFSTFSKLRNMVRAKTSTWSASTIYRDRKRLASRLNQFDDWATVRLKKQTKSQKSKKSFEPGSFGDARKFFALSLTNGSSVTRATMARVTSSPPQRHDTIAGCSATVLNRLLSEAIVQRAPNRKCPTNRERAS